MRSPLNRFSTMPTPTWLEKASAEVKEGIVKRLNGERADLGEPFSRRKPALEGPDLDRWNDYVFVHEDKFRVPVGASSEKYRLRARYGKAFASFYKELTQEDAAREAAASWLIDINNWRTGSASLPSIIRRCRYEECARFFLIPKSRPGKLYCSDVCGRNFRSAKSMNKKNHAERERTLKRVRAAIEWFKDQPDWKERAARTAKVSKSFISYAIRRGKLP
jgi:hypothetical protein